MSGSRHIADVFSAYSGSCETIADSRLGDMGDACAAPGLGSAEPGKDAVLARAIELEIIPRLMLAHKQFRASQHLSGAGARIITDADVVEFAAITVRHDCSVAQAFTMALISQGATYEQLFIELLAPAARRLGELWESDYFSFSDVTIGLSRIQQLVHEVGPGLDADPEISPGVASALLIPMPSEQHSLGVLLVEEFFRRAGWNVWTPQNVTSRQLVAIVRQERFDMVGISVTCEVEVQRLAALVESIRSASLNKGLLVMVGGRFINEHPELVAQVGADATDVDGTQAAGRLEELSTRLRT
jgi:methanogenic corrinoid protein MtbC1